MAAGVDAPEVRAECAPVVSRRLGSEEFSCQGLDCFGLGGDASAFVVDWRRIGVEQLEEAADRLDVGGPVSGLVDGVPVAGAGAGAVGGQAEVDGDEAPTAVAGEAGQRDRGEGASERGVNAGCGIPA